MLAIFDGHLDLAMNALFYKRDLTRSVEELREREKGLEPDGRGIATLSLPELRAAGVGVCVTTLIARAKPHLSAGHLYKRATGDWPTQDMAHGMAFAQLAFYRRLEARGLIRIVETREALADHWSRFERDPVGTPLGVILTMEGADPITTPEEVADWHRQGLRSLMLAHFGYSHYAAGTPPVFDEGDPDTPEGDAPLTEAGHALLEQMASLSMPLDLTHLSDTSFAEAADAYEGRVYASHSNARALSNMARQLTDEQIRTIGQRDGVIGVVVHNGMIRWTDGRQPPKRDVSMTHLAEHVDHICQLVGDAEHVAIGSDLDGGYGRDSTPREFQRYTDLHHLAVCLSKRGLSDADIAGVFHRNWLRFFDQTLPPEQPA